MLSKYFYMCLVFYLLYFLYHVRTLNLMFISRFIKIDGLILSVNIIICGEMLIRNMLTNRKIKFSLSMSLINHYYFILFMIRSFILLTVNNISRGKG